MLAYWAIVLLLIICASMSIALSRVHSLTSALRASLITKQKADLNDDISEQIYSRQLLVFGKSAQKSLNGFHVGVAVHSQSQLLLADEVVKNLAMAGIGTLSFFVNCSEGGHVPSMRLISSSKSLYEYAKGLNLRIEVYEKALDDLISGDSRCDLLLSIGGSFAVNVNLNEKCRGAGIPMIVSQVEGVCGFVFNDFLNSFTSKESGEVYSKRIPLQSVALVSTANSNHQARVQVKSIPEEALSLGLGEVVRVSWDNFQEFLCIRVDRVVNRHTVEGTVFNSSMANITNIKSDSLTAEKVIEMRSFTHQSLRQQLRKPVFSPCNDCMPAVQDQASNLVLLACFQASNKNSNSKLEFMRHVKAKLARLNVREADQPVKKGGVGKELLERLVYGYYRGSKGGACCPATASVLGAIAAHEAIKAATGIHFPVNQFQFFESFASLPHTDESVSASNNNSVESVYGIEIANELKRMRILIVGSGAIGCELLKNMALLGVGESSSDGVVHVVDGDCIEISNLSRQLLFRESDVGQAKAIVAAEAARQINPELNVCAHTNMLCEATEHIFNSKFWSRVDVVASALDSVDARRYVDEQVVAHGKWFLDSGTLGASGNVQVVIPHVSESYSSTSDPVEDNIPLCTLKSFPYLPEHCVAWAKQLYEQLFVADVALLRDDLGRTLNSSIRIENAMALLNCSKEDKARIEVTLKTIAAPTPMNVVKWARTLLNHQFHDSVIQLLRQHPADSVDDETGEPFWSGSRRLPITLSNDTEDARAFIENASLIFARVWNVNVSADEIKQALDEPEADSDYLEFIRTEALRGLLGEPFEKDNLKLGHVDFVTAASALRGAVFGIGSITGGRLAVQHLAGKIIPAVVSTTAVVSGLSCLELIKIAAERVSRRRNLPNCEASLTKKGFDRLRKFKTCLWRRLRVKEKITPIKRGLTTQERQAMLSRFRNSFVNLARPSFSFTEPTEAQTFSVGDESFTQWDALPLPLPCDSSELVEILSHTTVEYVQGFIEKRFANAKLETLSVDDVLLWEQGRVDASLLALLKNCLNESELHVSLKEWLSRGFLDLEAICSGEGDHFTLPPLRLVLDSGVS